MLKVYVVQRKGSARRRLPDLLHRSICISITFYKTGILNKWSVSIYHLHDPDGLDLFTFKVNTVWVSVSDCFCIWIFDYFIHLAVFNDFRARLVLWVVLEEVVGLGVFLQELLTVFKMIWQNLEETPPHAFYFKIKPAFCIWNWLIKQWSALLQSPSVSSSCVQRTAEVRDLGSPHSDCKGHVCVLCKYILF